ncbi:MAG: AraC family transcriptional regulator [Alistipes sp.]|nr:AraC family transcriptional regulator [Alistipes sp.]
MFGTKRPFGSPYPADYPIMNENSYYLQDTEKPLIEKYAADSRNEIRSCTLSRCAVGCVLRGEKYVYYGDECYRIAPGQLFLLETGDHYVKDVASDEGGYEQIVIYYSAPELEQELLLLGLNYHVAVGNDHSCGECDRYTHALLPFWRATADYFRNLNDRLADRSFLNDPVAVRLKMTELLYLIVSHGDSCLKHKLLNYSDAERDLLRQVVSRNIFSGASIEELARMCGRSQTSFKKDFGRLYGTSPHQWFLQRRLVHARLLLISTDRSINDIGAECMFANSSHFIKLFKKEYGLTPAGYRRRTAAASQAGQPREAQPLAAAQG